MFLQRIDSNAKAGCFAFIVLLMSYYCKCFVALPDRAMGRSAVCDCGIS